LEKLARRFGVGYDEAVKEIDNRRLVLKWMTENSISDYKDVAKVIRSYYLNPAEFLEWITVGKG